MSKTSNKSIRMVWMIGTFAILFSASVLISATLIQQKSAYGISRNITTGQMTAGEKTQLLSKGSVPVLLPLINGYVKGHEVYYITTEASEKAVSDYFD